jgi:hypothetical protein
MDSSKPGSATGVVQVTPAQFGPGPLLPELASSSGKVHKLLLFSRREASIIAPDEAKRNPGRRTNPVLASPKGRGEHQFPGSGVPRRLSRRSHQAKRLHSWTLQSFCMLTLLILAAQGTRTGRVRTCSQRQAIISNWESGRRKTILSACETLRPWRGLIKVREFPPAESSASASGHFSKGVPHNDSFPFLD